MQSETMKREKSWLERVEEIIHVLEGSSVGELELTEGGTEIIIRRQPGMHLVANVAESPTAGGHANRIENGVSIVAPLTGVYYAAPSPTTPPFVNVGDMVYAGQVVALVEAMKVFNEISSEVSGRVIALVATNGNVVQKGEVLIRVEP
jgi:acetyl-CoA carboxylase biotin carboxyl carrier protein